MCVLMSPREVYINLLIEILVLLKSILEHYSLSGLKKLRIFNNYSIFLETTVLIGLNLKHL